MARPKGAKNNVKQTRKYVSHKRKDPLKQRTEKVLDIITNLLELIKK